MARTPMVRLGPLLVATVGDALDDQSALQLQTDIAERVVSSRAPGVLLDISALEVVDSFICAVLVDTAAVVRVLGAEVALVGMRPAVAITAIELGLPLQSLLTARDLEHGARVLGDQRARRDETEAAARSFRTRPSLP